MSQKFIPDPPEWSRWFAWHPIWVRRHGGYIRVWWEWVDRTSYGAAGGIVYSYRLSGDPR